MDYKIAVVDDEAAAVSALKELTDRWAERTGNRILLRAFPSAEAFLFCFAEEKDFDVLLLDIEMSGMDGVTLAKNVRRENETVQIVFVTGYSDYIAEGYEVAALHYLVKPVRAEKLWEVLDRAAERLRKNERTLVLENTDGVFRVPLREIRWLEVRQNYVTVHAREDVTVKQTLGTVEKLLDERFFRMGRSFIVNLNCVSRVSRSEVILSDGTALPLPRGQYEPLNRAIIAMK